MSRTSTDEAEVSRADGGDVVVLSLSCNHCGANLDIAEDTRFVTCGYCKTRLSVEHTGGAAYTKIHEALSELDETVKKTDKRSRKLQRELGAMRLERELERLEREWNQERTGLMLRSKNGKMRVPTRSSSFVVYLFGPAAGLLFLAVAGLSVYAVLAVLVLTIIGVFGGRSVALAALRYEAAERRYRDERDRLEAELDKARR
jgi:hypothetical protein